MSTESTAAPLAALTPEDKALLREKGIPEEVIELQLENFRKGFPYLRISESARVGNGILHLDPLSLHNAVNRWTRYLEEEGECCKFVPASGAASRMFKAVHTFINGDTDSLDRAPAIAELISNLEKLPFYSELDKACRRIYGTSALQMRDESRNRDLMRALIGPEGLNYGGKPKALLLFHAYPFGARLAVEEQLVEASRYVASNGLAHLHFTVSQEHVQMFRDTLSCVTGPLQELTDTRFDITMSVQKPSTDTIAANADGTPFRRDGKLFFRPGGHGSLIENLNDLPQSVVFVKNIDNVVREDLIADTVTWKMALGGVLLQVRDSIHKYINKLSRGHDHPDLVPEVISFMRDILAIEDIRFETLKGRELVDFLLSKLNRPIRVCGMVKNEGEPGGGPYLAYSPDGSIAPQILESVQIDMNDTHNLKMMKQSTHFNPVDLVCYIKDVDGRKFNLPDYVDPSTGFISSKSVDGRELRAMERPGLWNGAMSDWNTVFVEVPVSTFNPVKTVNDLLRPTHNSK